VTWEPGRERVRELIDAGELDRITPDLAIAHGMLEDAGRHLAPASAAKRAGDLSGAYQLPVTLYGQPGRTRCEPRATLRPAAALRLARDPERCCCCY
jgi:hypothetical protein